MKCFGTLTISRHMELTADGISDITKLNMAKVYSIKVVELKKFIHLTKHDLDQYTCLDSRIDISLLGQARKLNFYMQAGFWLESRYHIELFKIVNKQLTLYLPQLFKL